MWWFGHQSSDPSCCRIHPYKPGHSTLAVLPQRACSVPEKTRRPEVVSEVPAAPPGSP